MKGHGMELSLNKNANFSSNETPTPTRFIRNCEAIGLFQDLNPFEETFKKAVENSKRGTPKTHGVSFLGKSAGDELHTPQVCLDGTDPHLLETGEIRQVDDVEEVVVRSEADTSICAERAPPPPQPSSASSGNVSEESVQVLFQMPNGTVLQLSAKPLKNDTPQVREAIRIAPVKTVTSETIVLAEDFFSVPPKQSPTTPLVKEKLKAFLDGSIKAKQEKEAPAPQPKHVAIPSLKKFQTSSSQEERRTYPLISDPSSETVDKKRQILERNRKAAYRCREKRKRRIENLENDNKMLAQEVTALRAEVLRLQSLLMAHSNCSLSPLAQSGQPASHSSQQVLTAKPVQVLTCTVEPPRTSLAVPLEESKPVLAPKRVARTIQQRKERLTLDIVRATENTMMDLDSPSIVKRDEVLGSVGPPCTPDEKIDPFVDLERDMGEPFEKHINSTTTVIQLNPNVLKEAKPAEKSRPRLQLTGVHLINNREDPSF